MSRPREYVFTPEQEAEMIRLMREHVTMNQIGKLFGCSDDRVRKVATKHGVKPNARGHGPDMGKRIAELYEASDMSVAAMQKTLGITHKVLARFVKEMGLVRKVKTRYKKRDQKPYREAYIERYGEEEGLIRLAALQAKHRANAMGSGNPMYGKPSPQGSGNGWKGWYRGHYFRSLREVAMMVKLDVEGKAWTHGEKVTIPYQTPDGNPGTYRPDFIVGNLMIEIKPVKLHASPRVQAKAAGARVYCAANGLEYRLIDIEIDSAAILKALDAGDIRFDRDYEARFREYLKDRQPPEGPRSPA